MHLTPADYLEVVVDQAAQTNREFVAFLRSYDESTGAATIASSPRGAAISASVAPRIRSFPGLLAPNARVLVKKLPGHPLVVSDVLDLAQTRGTAQVLPGPGQFQDELFRLRVAGFAAGEPLSFSARDFNDLPFVLHAETFTLTTDAHGSGTLPFVPQRDFVLFAGWAGPVTLYLTGVRSGITASVSFTFFFHPRS